MLDMTQPMYDAYEEANDKATKKYNQALSDFKYDATYSVSVLKKFDLDAKKIATLSEAFTDIKFLLDEYYELDLSEDEFLQILGEML
jgi:Cu/Ag efflux protein CusF